MERLSRKDDKAVYQPKIRAARIRDLHRMKEFTRRPMTVLVDEALSIFLANFITSPEYTAWCESIERGVEERMMEEPNNDDYEDLSTFIENA